MLIIIGGSSRSGTTMMYELFSGDQKTNRILAESVPLQHLVHAYQQTTICEQQDDWFPAGDPKPVYREFVKQLLTQVPALSESTPHRVLKCPTMTRYLPALADLVDDVRCVVLIRDPRDIITSQIRVARRQKEQLGWATNRDHASENHHRLALLVLQAYEAILREGPARLGSKLMFLRYEDFVRDPVPWVQRLREHTGVDLGHFEPEEAIAPQGRSFGPGFRTQLSGGPIVSNSVHAFRDFLPVPAVETIERVCVPFMRLWGYAPVCLGPPTAEPISDEVPGYAALAVAQS